MARNPFHRRVAVAVATTAFLAASGFAGTARAVVFDFGAIGVGQEQGNPGEADGTPVGLRFLEGSVSVFTDGFDAAEAGLQVIATGQNVSGGGVDDSPFAYLDGLSGGREAGVGVCQELTGSDQCTPSSDDNVTGGDPSEQLTLTFNDLVAFTGITFKSENHFDVDDGELAGTDTLLINGTETTFAGALATLVGIGPATTFEFLWGGDSPEQFYVGVAEVRRFRVPEPGTLGILGAGVILLGIVGRRRMAR